MDASGEVADLMVKESIQLTEESIKLLAAGCKNLTAFLYALAKDNKKLVGKTSMKRLLREGKELKTFCIKAEDLNDFRKYAKPNILFAAIRDTKEDDGLVALVTNTDFVSQVNLFMQRRGYPAPTQTQEDDSFVKFFLCGGHGKPVAARFSRFKAGAAVNQDCKLFRFLSRLGSRCSGGNVGGGLLDFLALYGVAR